MEDWDEECWRKKLVVKNVPENWSPDLIQNFLEVVTGGEVSEDGLEYFGNIRHTVLVTFTERLSGNCIEEAKSRVRQKGKFLDLILISKDPTAVLVRDMPPSLTHDNLFYYFDSPRSGGTEGEVLEDGLELFPNLRMAVVTFSSNAVAASVLAVQEHHPSRDITVTIAPCYDEFHKFLLDELRQLAREAPASSHHREDSNSAKPFHHAQSSPDLPELHKPTKGRREKPLVPPKPAVVPRMSYAPDYDDQIETFQEKQRETKGVKKKPEVPPTPAFMHRESSNQQFGDHFESFQNAPHSYSKSPLLPNTFHLSRSYVSRSQSMDSFNSQSDVSEYNDSFDDPENWRNSNRNGRAAGRFWRGPKGSLEPFSLYPPRQATGFDGDNQIGPHQNTYGRFRNRGRRRNGGPSPNRAGFRGRGRFGHQNALQDFRGRSRRRQYNKYISKTEEAEEQFCYGGQDYANPIFSRPSSPLVMQPVLKLDAECNPLPPDPELEPETAFYCTDDERKVSDSAFPDGQVFSGCRPKTRPLSPRGDSDQTCYHPNSAHVHEDTIIHDDESRSAAAVTNPELCSSEVVALPVGAKVITGQTVQEVSERERKLEEEVQKVKEQLENEKKLLEKKKQKTVRLPVPTYRLQVLKHQLAEEFALCEVTVLEKEGAVLFHGNEEDCETVRCIFLEKIQALAEDKLSLGPSVSTIFRTKQGQSYLNRLCQSYPQCSVDVQDSCIVCAALSTNDISRLFEDISRNKRQEVYKVSPTVLGNPELLTLKTKLEGEFLVQLTIPTGGSRNVIIDGINGDVDMALRDLKQLIADNQPARKKFHIDGALAATAVKQWYSNQLDEAKGLILKTGSMESEESAVTGYTLTFQCRQEMFQEVQDRLGNISMGIFCASINLQDAFAYSERSLVINGLHSCGVEAFCATLKHKLDQTGVRGIFSFNLPEKCLLPKLRYDTKLSRRRKHHIQPRSQGARPLAALAPQPRPRQFDPYTATIGQTSITIKTGDISHEKAQVIVSIVGEDLNLKGTAVGLSLLKKFPQIAQDLQNQQAGVQGGECQVIPSSTPTQLSPVQQALQLQSGGNASVPLILHVVLRKLSGLTLTATLNQLTQKCLQYAIQHRKTSIAFPPLGVGRKFGFPVETVANAMTSIVARFSQQNPRALQNVTFVIFDMDTAKKFKVALKQRVPSQPSNPGGPFLSSAASARPAFPNISDEDAFTDDDCKLSADDDDDDDSSGLRFTASDSNSSGSDNDVLSFVDLQDDSGPTLDFRPSQTAATRVKFEALVCTQSQGQQSAAKDLLMKELRSTFLWTETVQDLSTLRKLGSKTLEEMQAAATKETVLLQASEKDNKLLVRGQKAGVAQVLLLIKDRIHKLQAQGQRQDTTSPHQGLRIPARGQIPGYWKICKKGMMQPLKDLIRTVMQMGKLHPMDGEERKAIEQLISVTWMQKFVGHGRDGRGLSHSNIKVVKVERLEHPELWEKYSAQRERTFVLLELNKQRGFTPIEKLPGSSGPVKTTNTLKRCKALCRDVYPVEVNEHYLFHGTKPEYLNQIVDSGLDIRISSDNAMLGRGVYASESPTKADQYTDDKTQRKSGNKTMILLRMLLGEPFLNNAANPTKYKRPPCMKCHKDVCLGHCSGAKRYDSVIDDSQRNFREFVIYESDRCYPEYFITYQRV